MSDVKLLKSEAAYVRWAGDTFEPRPPRWIYRDDEIGRSYREAREYWRRDVDKAAPESYPCIAVLVVSDWGMQWECPVYIYPADAERLIAMAAEEER